MCCILLEQIIQAAIATNNSSLSSWILATNSEHCNTDEVVQKENQIVNIEKWDWSSKLGGFEWIVCQLHCPLLSHLEG